MRILFMGTDEFAIPSLSTLFESKHELIGVVTQPDRPSGRGRKLKASPVKKLAGKLSISVYQPERVSDPDFVEEIRKLEPELIVVAAYGQILKENVLDCPSVACVNVHPSLLPKYRGAAPIQRAIIDGEKQTGVTIILMDEGEDTGDIVTQKPVKIEREDTAISLKDKLSKIAADILIEVVDKTQESGDLPHIPQKDDEATYAPKLTKEDGKIDWSKSAEDTYNLVRGSLPWPGAYTYYNGKMIKIISSEAVSEDDSNDAASEAEPLAERLLPGTIIVKSKKKIEVVTGEGKLVVNELQPANKRKMDARDFINGYRLKTGVRFGTE